MTFEEGMKQSIEETEREKCELLGIIQEKDKAIAELVEKKTALEKRCFELEQENETLIMGLQYDSDNRDDILNENSDLQQKCLEESFEKSKLVKEKSKLCEQNNELVEENGTLKTQVSILQGKNKGLKELVKGYENTRDRMIAMGFPTFKSVKEYAAKLADLETENAELKEINEGYCRSRDKLISMGFPTFMDCKEYAKHLTNAKEIIREFVEWATWQGSNCPSFQSIQNNAEQFLKEIEG